MYKELLMTNEDKLILRSKYGREVGHNKRYIFDEINNLYFFDANIYGPEFAYGDDLDFIMIYKNEKIKIKTTRMTGSFRNDCHNINIAILLKLDYAKCYTFNYIIPEIQKAFSIFHIYEYQKKGSAQLLIPIPFYVDEYES